MASSWLPAIPGVTTARTIPRCRRFPMSAPFRKVTWTISGPPINTAEHGPFVLTLTAAGANTLVRSGFLMHGDSVNAPGTASKGCIIMPRTAREQVWNSGDTALEVVPELATQDLSDQNA